MPRFYRFRLKKYHGFAITFWIFKVERIGYKDKFMWRFEISNWRE